MAGRTRAPFVTSSGRQECVDWQAHAAARAADDPDYDFGYYQLYPDLVPDLDWAGFDGKNLRWGIKPAEKTIIYSIIADGA